MNWRTGLFLAGSCFIGSVSATSLPWNGSPYFVMTQGINVSKLLADLGANYGVPVVVSSEVDDVFSGTLDSALPQTQLDELARLFNLAWYFDGKILFVYKAREISSIAVSADPAITADLQTELKKMNILNRNNCQMNLLRGSNTYEITGVPVCLKRISDLLVSLGNDAQAQTKSDEQREDVQVFPLVYASATDVTYQYRNQSVIVPGVVSVLKDMSGSDSLKLGKSVATQQAEDTQTSSSTEPLFSADPRQNAVIVRDRAANMPMYQHLIKQLDKRQQGIDISVSIIDVDASDLNQLGVDWAANASVGSGNIQFNADLLTGSAGTFSSVVNNSGDFMVKVSALETQSKAKVLSSPSVMTLNNVQAVLDKNATFYTKLVGDKVAQLASITSGTLMQVTPRLVNADGHTENVLLILSIQDGNQQPSQSATETMPMVNNSEIDTQAMLKPGQSLLLGGFVQDQTATEIRKIPLLGDIPLIGGLFSSVEKSKNKIVRLFLIKAEPVNIN